MAAVVSLFAVIRLQIAGELTLMSIEKEIKQRILDGSLKELPLRAGRKKRRLYVEATLYEEIVVERDDLEMMDRYTKLEADLNVFVTSQTINPHYLYLLSPTRDKVWEIRSVEPKPQLRVFGFFAAKDTFVATNHEYRDELGGFDSAIWRREKRRALAIWRNLFNSYNPIDTIVVGDLVTGAIDGKYFRN